MGGQSTETGHRENLLSRQRMREILILSLLIVSVYGAFRIVAPYLHAIILAALFAYLFSPIHGWVQRKITRRQNLAAFLSCVIVSLVVLVPLLGFASTLVYRGVETFASVQSWLEQAKLEEIDWTLDPDDIPPAAETVDGTSSGIAAGLAIQGHLPGNTLWTAFVPSIAVGATQTTLGVLGAQRASTPSTPEAQKIQAWLNSPPVQTLMAWKKRFFPTVEITGEQLRNWIFNQSQAVVSYLSDKAIGGVRNVVVVLTNFLLMLFVMFYLFRDGQQIMGYVERLSPLTDEQERMLIDRVQGVSKSAVAGTLLTAVAQGVLGMIAFAITGIPWLVWGVMMGFASLIPVVGTALVWVPCVIYLFIIGSTFQAIFLALWCMIVVGLADNLLRPYLMQGKANMSSLLLFFAILGGLQLFGLVGVIYGPLVFGLCAVMLYIFQLETAERRKRLASADGSADTDPDADPPRPEPEPKPLPPADDAASPESPPSDTS